MTALLLLIYNILGFYLFFVVLMIIMSWLYTFGVVPHHNQIINKIMGMLYSITEPILGRIRAVVPAMGGLDFAPLILIFAIYFLRDLIRFDIMPMLS